MRNRIATYTGSCNARVAVVVVVVVVVVIIVVVVVVVVPGIARCQLYPIFSIVTRFLEILGITKVVDLDWYTGCPGTAYVPIVPVIPWKPYATCITLVADNNTLAS